MLCQFSVKNYKSFRDEMTLDMTAAAISEHKDKIIQTKYGDSFLPISAIYGPNGGGKSNALNAIQVLIAKVMNPLCAICNNSECWHKVQKSPIIPFMLTKDTTTKPTEFELFFRTDMAEYKYVLHVRRDIVVHESLSRMKLDTSRTSTLFTRDKDIISLKGSFSKIRISEEISETLPLLSYLGITYKKNTTVSDIISWFEHSINILDYNIPNMEFKTLITEDDNIKSLLIEMMKEMDLDIEDFRIDEKDEKYIKIYTIHIVDGCRIEIPLEEESSGTKKLFGLLPVIIYSLVKGTTLVIDELDSKIHPVLLRYIIMLFTNMNINKKAAQLIFTSHDLSTMSNELFRRDEIWFTAKGIKQNSKLYSLVEFKRSNGESVRMDAKYDKQYLEGKYDANPCLKGIIDWSM